MMIFIIGAIAISCSNNNKRLAEYYINLIYSLDKNKIMGQTDLSVNWREETLLFWIQVKKDSISMPFYIKERRDHLMLRSGKKWIYLDSLQTPKVAILDSIYLQKDRIEYFYFLMEQYPFKKVTYISRNKIISIEIDSLKFFYTNDSLFFNKYKNMKKLKNGWWVNSI